MPRTKKVKEEKSNDKEEKSSNITKYGDDDKEDYVEIENRSITVNFSKLLDRELGDLNTVMYSFKRRAFYSFYDLIGYNLNYLLNKMPLIGIIYLDFHTKIYSDEDIDYTFDEMFNDIKENLIYNSELKEIISDIVESTYTITLDKDSENIKKQIIEDLQVTDITNKSILKSAILIRLIIPIISEFEEKFGYEKNTRVYNTIFTEVIRDYSEGGSNSLVKLNKMIDSRVEGTEYSDQVIWNYLKKLGIDPFTLKCEIKSSVVFSIIAKMNINTSIVSFLDVVIKNKISNKFLYNYPVSYRTFKVEQQDDEVDENERIDITLKQSSINEGKVLIHQIAIRNYIKKLKYKYNFNKEDIDILKSKIGYLNEIHKKLLEVYYSNKFNLVVEGNDLYYLLLGMINDLKRKGYIILPKILVSKIDFNTKMSYGNRSLNKTIIQSKDYIELLDNYKFTLDLIGKDDFILKFSSISSYKFVYINEDNEEEVLKIDKNALSLEIINFAKMI